MILTSLVEGIVEGRAVPAASFSAGPAVLTGLLRVWVSFVMAVMPHVNLPAKVGLVPHMFLPAKVGLAGLG